ncbi:MAG: helix-turn-helix transcriptional regulator [Alphaproteobacteria bacterium]|nr:helix-turn-helix transcriptional regulator [Alphaproteobacteria bacterium]
MSDLAPPFQFEWSTAEGFGSADLAEGDVPVPLPSAIGTERMVARPLGHGAGIFDHGFRLTQPLSITGTKLADQGVLFIRTGLTRDALCHRHGLGTFTESVGQYSLHLCCSVGATCRVTYANGEPSIGLAPIITEDRLRHMLTGFKAPRLIERFVEGNGEDWAAQPRYSPTMRKLVEEIRSAPYEGAMLEFYLQGKVFEMLAAVFSDIDEATESRRPVIGAERAKIAMACQLLQRDLSKPPSQEDLAAKIGMAPRRLATAFREVTGASMIEWLLDRKLEEAGRLLTEGDMAIKQIAFRLGYSHVGNFTAAFSRRFGVPPANYRKTTVMNHFMMRQSS